MLSIQSSKVVVIFDPSIALTVLTKTLPKIICEGITLEKFFASAYYFKFPYGLIFLCKYITFMA